MKLADLDGLGGLDVVVSIYAADKVGVLLNNGAGGLAPMQTYDACNGPVDVELGDVMAQAGGLLGDGRLDAVVACVDSGGVARLPGNGNGGFGTPSPHALPVAPPLGSASADPIELVNLRQGPPPVLVFQGTGGPGNSPLCISWDYSATTGCLNTGDYARVASPMTEGDVDGGDQPGTGPDEIVTRLSIAAGDVSGDGATDFVVTDALSAALMVMTNTTPHVGPGGGPPPPLPPAKLKPLDGLKGLPKTVKASARGLLTLGSAKNPPAASTKQTVVVPVPRGSAQKRKRKPKLVTVASGRTTIPAGRTRKLTAKLTKAGRMLLKRKRKLRGTLVVVARATDGTTATMRKGVVVRATRAKKRRQ